MEGEGKRRAWLLWLFPAAAFGLFLVYLAEIRDQPFVRHLVANPLVYEDQANQMLKLLPPSQPFFLSPLYPAFVAAIYYLTGASRIAVFCCQGLLLAVNVALLGIISRRLFSDRVAAIAMGLAVCYWSFYYFAGELLPTMLAITFLLAGIVLWLDRDRAGLSPIVLPTICFAGLLFGVHAVPGLANLGGLIRGSPLPAPPGPYVGTLLFVAVFAVGVTATLVVTARSARLRAGRNLLASGIVLGTSMLVWGGTALAVALLGLRLILARSRKWSGLAFLVVGLAIPILASSLNNYSISGEIIPVTSSFGINLFVGNNTAAGAMDPFRFGEGNRARIEADRLRLSGAARSAFFSKRAIQFISREPLRWLGLVGKKLFISIGRTEIDNNADISERRNAWARLALPILHFGIIFPLAMLGVWYILTHRLRGRSLIIGYIGLAAISVIFFPCERFRLPAIAMLLPLAALGTETLVRSVIRRSLSSLLPAALILTAAALASNIDFLGTGDIEFPSITINKAHVARLEGDFDTAQRLVADALKRQPESAGAYYQLAAIEEAKGNIRQAAEYYLDSLEQDPYFYGSYAGAKRILEEARISTSYLDLYISNVIQGLDSAGDRRKLADFLERRLP